MEESEIREALEALNTKDREEIFDAFEDYFYDLYKAGELTKAGYYKLASHRAHLSVDRILELIEENREARQFVARLLERKAEVLRKVAQQLKA